MDAHDFPCRGPLQRAVAQAIAATATHGELDELAHYDDDLQRLFAFLVAGLEVYIAAVMTDAGSRPLGETETLAERVVDRDLLESPEAFADLDRARFERYLSLTLAALRENLVH